MAILQDEHPRVGCLAVPISAVAGFLLAVLLAAAVGASAGLAGVIGLGGAVAAAAISVAVLRNSA